MDEEQRQLGRDPDTNLRDRTTSALRAGRLREAGWLVRGGLLTGDLVDDALLDATAPALDSYAVDDPRDYPVKDLAPPQVAWLPDGRLAVNGTNTHQVYAWDLASGEHTVLHHRDEVAAVTRDGLDGAAWWTSHARNERLFVSPAQDRLYLTYGEDLPTGGTPTAQCHWLAQPLDGGALEYLGFHDSHHLVGAAGGELLGLDTWHRGSTGLHAWTPGGEIERRSHMLAESIRLAPGTCLRCGHLRDAHPEQRPAHVVHYEQKRLRDGPPAAILDAASPDMPQRRPATPAGPPPPPTTPVVFYTPDGREVVAEVPFSGTFEATHRRVATAWAGRALVASEDHTTLTLYRHAEALATQTLPSDLPLDAHWVATPHPSGWIVALVFSGRDELVLFDLRDGSERRVELPKYFNGYRVAWSPGGELALLNRQAVFLRPA